MSHASMATASIAAVLFGLAASVAAQTETGPGPVPKPEPGPGPSAQGSPGSKIGTSGVTKAGEQDCEAVWRSADADQDDTVSGNELANFRGVLSQLDTDRSGSVSHDEFNAACGKGLLKGIVIR